MQIAGTRHDDGKNPMSAARLLGWHDAAEDCAGSACVADRRDTSLTERNQYLSEKTSRRP